MTTSALATKADYKKPSLLRGDATPCIETDEISRALWSSIRTFNYPFDFSTDILNFDQFLTEVFHRAYFDPVPTFKEPLPPEALYMAPLHDVLSRPEFMKLFAQVRGKANFAAMASYKLAQRLLNQHMHKPPEPIQDMTELRYQAFQAKQAGNTNKLKELQERGQRSAEIAKNYAQELKSRLNGESLANPETKARELDQMAQSISEDLGNTEETAESLWGDEKGYRVADLPIDLLLKLSRLTNNSRLEKIVKTAGRMTRVAFNARSKSKSPATFGAVNGIEAATLNLSGLLPCEVALLADEGTEDIALAKLLRGDALKFQYEEETTKQGPLVLCIDGSSSMAGDPEVLSRAFMIAIAKICKKTRRNMTVIYFTRDIESRYHLNYRSSSYETELLYAAVASFRGGTNFDLPLKESVKVITKESTYKKADILFLTDGDCFVSPDIEKLIQKTQKEKNLRLFTLLMDEGSMLHDKHPLRTLSQGIWDIDSDSMRYKDGDIDVATGLSDLFETV